MCPAVAYEMLVSHSPPVFSHSPPHSFLSDYSPLRLSSDMFPFNTKSNHRSIPPSLLQFTKNNPLYTLAPPKRPCLIHRPLKQPDIEEAAAKLKKKVVFADDKGMSLTHVRIMTEPSNVPPLWSYKFLAEVTQGISAEPEARKEPWEVTFSQPASDYVNFRKKLDNNKVSLENVIVKDFEEIILGTVKVNNMSYSKKVIVRMSSNSWKTFEDATCTYVPNLTSSPATPVYVLYDTFSFKIRIPPRARNLEFCICFQCGDKEYWDNNDGSNYRIIKKVHYASVHKSYSSDNLYKKQCDIPPSKNSSMKTPTDVVEAKIDSWSEFASWTHLDNSKPYW